MGNSISYTETPHDIDLGPKGSVRGIQYDTKARRYAGIPFALPPTGQRRWQKPRRLPADFTYHSPDSPISPYDATKSRALCLQKAFHVGEGGDAAQYSEDCLFVNIWTPVPKDSDDKNKKWPVMLWLHGGWFQLGDPSHEPYMDPTELISTGGLDAIVVAIGYRLDDQRLGAEWVKENIALYGGDPDNITLAGRSAGAYSAEVQILYEFRRPEANKSYSLYRRAFMDSNAITAQPKSIADVEPQFDELCMYFVISNELSGSERLRKLREVTAGDLVDALSKLQNHTFRPVTDDLFVHDGMMAYLRSADFARAFMDRGYKLLIGEVLNEETLYSTYNSPEKPTLEALKTQVSNYYAPATVERALKYYELPDSRELDEWKSCFGRIIADGQVRAPSRALVNGLARNGVHMADIWRYQIAYRLSFITEKIAPASFGVAHAMDKPFWNFSIGLGPTPEERKLMEAWNEILVRFVRDGNPGYSFGTASSAEMKVATPEGTIEIRKDERWEELAEIGAVLAGEPV